MTEQQHKHVTDGWRRAQMALALLCLFGLALLGACRRAQQQPAATSKAGAAADPGIELNVDRGPLRFRVHADKKSVDLMETLRLRVEAEAPEGVSVELPKVGAELGAFTVSDSRTESSRLTDKGTMIHARTYVLDPLMADDYELPSLTARFTLPATEAGKDPALYELSTEPAKLDVRKPAEDFWQQLDIDAAAGLSPAAQLRPASPTWLVVTLVAVAVVVVLALLWYFWWRRRQRRQALAEVIPAHVKALAALQALVADDLIGRGAVEEFYHRISGILREYIEDRFSLRAPEQTTEEFMAALRLGGGAFSPAQRELLEQFLRHCDMVKFACHRPADKEIQATFDACKQFIMETTPAASAA